jgi:hypothetical protein
MYFDLLIVLMASATPASVIAASQESATSVAPNVHRHAMVSIALLHA